MRRPIEKAAVLGAGTMGARIAAHLANAGIPCFLLDIVPPELNAEEKRKGLTLEKSAVRNRIVLAGLEAAKKSRPAASFTPETARLITPGNFDDNLGWCGEADWIIEAVAENLEIKRKLFERVESVRKPGTIVTSNTSGLPIHLIAEGRSEDFQKHWAGTHFFNPPRYMKLAELIPGPKTLPDVLDALAEICDVRLGKGVVVAKDTPNFIANRIGTFSMLRAFGETQTLDMTVEEVDSCTGPAIGWPNSATFRTADIVGLDVLVHVIRNLFENLPGDESREMYRVPALAEEMMKRGWLGEKTGSGFYKRVKGVGGESEILTLDWHKMDYRPREKSKLGSIEAGKAIEETRERLRALVGPALEGQGGDKGSRFLWACLGDTCLYAARRVPEIADRILDIDRAMRWGFGWELGPFEVWDAIGVERMAKALERGGKQMPPLVAKVLASPKKLFYEMEKGSARYFDLAAGALAPVQESAGILILKSIKDRTSVVQENSGASLIDIGDGVLCCEFHAKMNAIGGDIFAMLQAGVARLESEFEAMVIANQAPNFSAGANLMLLLMTTQEGEWDDIHLAVRQFQRANMAIKYAPRPVVAAPQGMALGGGCEIPLHSAKIHAAAETYIGLVEAGVGLIPGGGGTKEMLIRANEHAAGGDNLDLMHALRPVFENIAMAKVSTSGEEARSLGYLRPSDLIAMNRDRQVADAKQTALAMVRAGYHPPAPAEIRVLGEEFFAAAKLAVHMMIRGEYATEYDGVVARKLAYIMAGGRITAAQSVPEQYILDLEREAFVSLCGERKTQERIAHTLKTGKPLRN
ncbi:MAG TPA: 3-hydroxyacyl-CoA dehydrogenase NAD-binding domain-containing protein [Candidatus Acidoferrales bacterium]|nr:3-hydroxyacyl-CoA dehydrogenase NAD-binding domain-containing protein [Candidatus Acidoferrales bacterium]